MTEQQAQIESPFDVITVVEVPTGAGDRKRPVPLYRKHRDEIDAYADKRVIPGATVSGILTGQFSLIFGQSMTMREWDGILGAVAYAHSKLPASGWGSIQRYQAHLSRAGLD